MSRLIDADALENEFGISDADIIAREVIRFAPTVDAVPVVRCQECIAYTPVNDKIGKCVFLIGEHQYVVPDGYCYLGERKEGAE